MNKTIENLIKPAAIRALLLKERLQSGASFNPLHPAMRSNPYPVYRRLREQDPVHWSELLKGWILTRHADVAMVLRDPRFSSDQFAHNPAVNLDEMGPYQRWFSKTLLSIDPPDHTRLRVLVVKAFTPRAIEALLPRIREITADLLDDVQERGRMDLIEDLAYPLPVIVIAEMIGVPTEDRAKFKRWSDDLGEGLEPMLNEEQLARADRSMLEIAAYFRGIIQERRRRPRQDLVSALVAAEEQGDRLSEDEMLATLILLLAAGNETTTNLIGNGVLALLRNPEQKRRLREHPGLIDNAVEEMLRFDSPVQMTGRTALEDVEIGNRLVRKGQFVATILGAANRDPERFPDAERFDVARESGRHLSLGLGIHYCLGAPLARVEGQIAIAELLRRFPDLRAAGRPAWRQTILLHGLGSLPVAFNAPAVTSVPESALEAVAG